MRRRTDTEYVRVFVACKDVADLRLHSEASPEVDSRSEGVEVVPDSHSGKENPPRTSTESALLPLRPSTFQYHRHNEPQGLFLIDFDRGETVLEESDWIFIAATCDAKVWLEKYKNGTSRAIKQGLGVLPEEAEVTHWVWTNTSVPVPQVMHADAKRSTPRLEFEYIDGKQLDEVWPTLAASERQTIADELVRAIQAMQDAPPPANGLIGSYQRVRTAPFRPDTWPQWPPYEPTTSTIEFFDWARSCALAIGMTSQTWDSKIAPHIRLDTKIVLTHGDLFPRNILIRNGHLAAIVDWELAGWWPEELEGVISGLQFFQSMDIPPTEQANVEASRFVADCVCRARGFSEHAKRAFWADLLFNPSHYGLQ
ncbi:Protein kinase-like domain-containing protein [Rhodotorula toruloides]|uniref:Protein kinase-like domain-containing protein n=1 Tax=Rhodotorula toruloides TaxID=5286 RepID=A0A2T0A917_RHOTO|nr:Protein kinase-like domain-containing protein [Rhodotorula toruloides]